MKTPVNLLIFFSILILLSACICIGCSDSDKGTDNGSLSRLTGDVASGDTTVTIIPSDPGYDYDYDPIDTIGATPPDAGDASDDTTVTIIPSDPGYDYDYDPIDSI